jgi:hypothetical protein
VTSVAHLNVKTLSPKVILWAKVLCLWNLCSNLLDAIDHDEEAANEEDRGELHDKEINLV